MSKNVFEPRIILNSTICCLCGQCNAIITLCSHCDSQLPVLGEFVSSRELARKERLDPNVDSESILRGIAKARRQLSQYDTLIVQLQSSRENLQSFIEYQKSRISPIHKLPPEIIQCIAKETCRENHIMSGILPTLSLSHINTYWRRLITSTSTLWTNLAIADSTPQRIRRAAGARLPAPLSQEAQFNLLSLYFQRSGSSSLHIRLLGSHSESPSASYKRLVKEATNHCRRWQNLTLSPDDIRLLDRIRGRLPELRSIKFMGRRILPSTGEDIFHCFEDAPTLVNVELGDILLRRLPLPSRQLTHLNLDWTRPSELFSALSGLNSLVSLTMQNMTMHDAPRDSLVYLPLPSLKSLYILGVSDGLSLPFVLENYTAPALTTLHLSNIYPSDWPEAEFFDFFSRSQCTITELTLECANITCKQLINLLRSVSHTEKLIFRNLSYWTGWGDIGGWMGQLSSGTGYAISDELFSTLGGDILPHLREFECTVDAPCTEEVLLNFLERRLVCREVTDFVNLEHESALTKAVLDMKWSSAEFEQRLKRLKEMIGDNAELKVTKGWKFGKLPKRSRIV